MMILIMNHSNDHIDHDRHNPGVLHRGQRTGQADVGEAVRDALPRLARAFKSKILPVSPVRAP